MVLEKDSSILGYPGEISKPLDADHRGVCKFDGPEDPNYLSVRNVIQSLIESHKPNGKLHFSYLNLADRASDVGRGSSREHCIRSVI
jgi:hypothetical protein